MIVTDLAVSVSNNVMIIDFICLDDVNQLHGPLHDEAIQRTSWETGEETSRGCQGPVSRVHAWYSTTLCAITFLNHSDWEPDSNQSASNPTQFSHGKSPLSSYLLSQPCLSLLSILWSHGLRRHSILDCSVLSRFGCRSFRVSGPTIWNDLSVDFRSTDITREQFKRSLKSWLFECAYGRRRVW